MPEGNAAGGARPFHLRTRDLRKTEAVGDKASQHFLSREGTGNEIAKV